MSRRADETGPEPDCCRIVLWPHQSLGRRGAVLLVGVIAVAMGLVLVKPLMAGAWPVAVAVLGTLIGFVLAFRHNRRSLLYRQLVEITPARIRVSHEGAGAGRPAATLDTAWARVELASDRSAESRLMLRQSRRSIELGAFLSPAEREALAGEIGRSIRKARSASGV